MGRLHWIAVGTLAVALAPVLADEGLREGAERDLDQRAGKLVQMARKAFEARDYEAARRLSLAAAQLRPGNDEAQELHRLSIRYGERLASAKPRASVLQSHGRESTEDAVDRMCGSRGVPWAEASKGTRARPPAEPKEAPKPDWQEKVEKRLAEPATVGFSGTPFSEVRDYFQSLLGCPVVVDARLREKLLALPVTFEARDMPAGKVLTWIVGNDLGMQYCLVDGAVYVSDADGICEKVGITEAYDVDDLLYLSRMPDFVGPQLGLQPEAPMGVRFDEPADDHGGMQAGPGLTPEGLVRILERTVAPGTWRKKEEKGK